MQLRTIGDALIYLGAVAAALAALGVLLRYAVVGPLKRWVVEQAKPAREAASQLKPNGGGSARDLMQKTADQVATMQKSMREYTAYATESREIAMSALTLARDVSSRLDRHLVDGRHSTE